jgi:hypothetical protein
MSENIHIERYNRILRGIYINDKCISMKNKDGFNSLLAGCLHIII